VSEVSSAGTRENRCVFVDSVFEANLRVHVPKNALGHFKWKRGGRFDSTLSLQGVRHCVGPGNLWQKVVHQGPLIVPPHLLFGLVKEGPSVIPRRGHEVHHLVMKAERG